jgi:hypothetical protein
VEDRVDVVLHQSAFDQCGRRRHRADDIDTGLQPIQDERRARRCVPAEDGYLDIPVEQALGERGPNEPCSRP